jgi:hypothetical protein
MFFSADLGSRYSVNFPKKYSKGADNALLAGMMASSDPSIRHCQGAPAESPSQTKPPSADAACQGPQISIHFPSGPSSANMPQPNEHFLRLKCPSLRPIGTDADPNIPYPVTQTSFGPCWSNAPRFFPLRRSL